MKNKEKELEKRIFELEAMLNHIPFEVWMKDLDGKYMDVNQYFAEKLGCAKENIIGKNNYDLFPTHIAEKYTFSDNDAIKSITENTYEWQLREDKFWKEYKKSYFDENGNLQGTVGCSGDITAEMQTKRALQESEALFRAVFEKAPLGISIYDTDTGMAYSMNDRYAEILGRTRKEAMEIDWKSYSHPGELEENIQYLKRLKNEEIKGFSMNKRFYKPDGTIVWVNMTNAFLKKSEDVHHHICMIDDITAQKNAEEKTRYLSYYDQLTGLHNRRFYEAELERLDCKKNLPLTLVMADVNGLKMTNDAFGHKAGDALLMKVAKILKGHCREGDVVARIGGDEFILLLPNTDSPKAERRIQEINGAIRHENDGVIICSISFGWKTKEVETQSISAIFTEAEDYMYRNKLTESKTMRKETIKLIAKALNQQNPCTQKHCQRVGTLCEKMALLLGFSETAVNDLKIAGLLHDIGKVGISADIVNKEGALTETEKIEIQRHPEIGYQILRSVSEFGPLSEYVLHHHERIDGKGYPGNLCGTEIPIQSKIISITEAFDAMVNLNSSKKFYTVEEAAQELKRSAGTQFDEDLVHIFVDKILNLKETIIS